MSFRFVILGDIHIRTNGTARPPLADVVRHVVEREPRCVLLAGDMTSGNPGDGYSLERVQTWWEALDEALAPLARELEGPDTGWSSLGVVVGATYPEQGERVRKRLPKSLFLVPGYGAQGGGAADAVRNFAKGPDGLEGGVVNSSRGISFPEAATDASSASQWERAIDDALSHACDDLSAAVSL